MSETLKAFYQAYLEWVESGAPDGLPFERHAGLCYNLRHCFIYPTGLNEALREMEGQFIEAGLDESFPFGRDNFYKRLYGDSQHKDRKRIAWVRKHAK